MRKKKTNATHEKRIRIKRNYPTLTDHCSQRSPYTSASNKNILKKPVEQKSAGCYSLIPMCVFLSRSKTE